MVQKYSNHFTVPSMYAHGKDKTIKHVWWTKLALYHRVHTIRKTFVHSCLKKKATLRHNAEPVTARLEEPDSRSFKFSGLLSCVLRKSVTSPQNVPQLRFPRKKDFSPWNLPPASIAPSLENAGHTNDTTSFGKSSTSIPFRQSHNCPNPPKPIHRSPLEYTPIYRRSAGSRRRTRRGGPPPGVPAPPRPASLHCTLPHLTLASLEYDYVSSSSSHVHRHRRALRKNNGRARRTAEARGGTSRKTSGKPTAEPAALALVFSLRSPDLLSLSLSVSPCLSCSFSVEWRFCTREPVRATLQVRVFSARA